MRIDKYLANAGVGSRKEVKKLIKDKHVSVNGELVRSDKIHIADHDVVCVDGEEISYQEYVYYMLNKPAGYVSATEDNFDPTVMDLIDDYHKELFPVGRLDKDTEGLLLITNDGQLAHRLLSPKHHVDKTYYAVIEGIVDQSDVEAFKEGIQLDEFMTKPACLEILALKGEKSEVEVTIQEGKFHQVKRMFIARGKKVQYLKRTAMGPLELDPDLPLRAYRPLTDDEIHSLIVNDMIK